MSALSETDKADLTKKIQDNITDGDLQKTLLKKLNPILRNDNDIETWKDDEDHWRRYKEQSIDDVAFQENAAFLVSIACEDPEGHIAIAMAERAAEDYDRAVAKALLNETCKGTKALTDEKRAILEKLGP